MTKETALTRDVALLAGRLVLAWIFVYHGAGTLFGAFGGSGLHRSALFYGAIAHLHPSTFFAALGGTIELLGGIGVGVGILGRLGASGLAGDMLIAMVTVTFSNGIVSDKPGGGYELNLVLAGLAFVIALLGTGRYSLDIVIKSLLANLGHNARAQEQGSTISSFGNP